MKKYAKAKRKTAYTYCPAYPNAAEPSYFTDRILNALTAAVSAMGFIVTLVCLVAMS